MQRVLIVTDVPFWRRTNGSQQRIAALADHLAEHFELTILYLGPGAAETDPRWETVHVSRHRGIGAFAWGVFERLPDIIRQWLVRVLNRSGYRRGLTSFRDERVRAAFEKLVHQERSAAVIIEYLWHGYLIDSLDQSQTLTILDTHDIRHQRVADYQRFGRVPDKVVTRDEELSVFSQFDRIIGIQSEDYAYIERHFAGKGLMAMHPVEVRAGVYRERLERRSAESRLTLIYLGAFSDTNLDAIEWFCRDVWSSELARTYELQIFGSICDTLHVEAPGIELRGRFESIEAVYRHADVAINPQRFGSGLKIKTIEAIGFGVPLVTTPVGAQGLSELNGRALLVADGADDLRTQLLRLADVSLRVALSDGAIEFAARELTPEACFADLRTAIIQHGTSA